MREILIAGLGSVGRRHLKNLVALGHQGIRLFRTRRSTLPDAELADFAVEYDLSKALARKPIAVIVSNPSALHVGVALAAARAGAHLLIEKPLSHNLDRIEALEHTVTLRRLAVLMGFQFRFNPGLQQIKTWIDSGAIGRVISAQVHWGEYLPAMHPWEDYRLGYAARRDLGGGVLLTLSHPLDYLRWLIGEVRQVSAIEAGDDMLEVAIDSCVDVSLRFAGGATGHVHLNFIQQPHEHRLEIVGTKGTVTWNHRDHAARRYCGSAQRWETVMAPDGFERNCMFLDEMRHFLSCIDGVEQPRCTLADGREALRIALAAKRFIANTAADRLIVGQERAAW